MSSRTARTVTQRNPVSIKQNKTKQNKRGKRREREREVERQGEKQRKREREHPTDFPADILYRHFPNWGSLFPDNYNLYQTDIKLASTHVDRNSGLTISTSIYAEGRKVTLVAERWDTESRGFESRHSKWPSTPSSRDVRFPGYSWGSSNIEATEPHCT